MNIPKEGNIKEGCPHIKDNPLKKTIQEKLSAHVEFVCSYSIAGVHLHNVKAVTHG